MERIEIQTKLMTLTSKVDRESQTLSMSLNGIKLAFTS